MGSKTKKILFIAKNDEHIRHFHIPFLKDFKDKGYIVHIASRGNEKLPYTDEKFDIPFDRLPLHINNLKSYLKISKIIRKYKYNIIHCHTPIGGVVGRIASINSRKSNTKIFYTAHGFHFFKGAHVLNWIIYYPIEKLLSRVTDVLITINKEDYSTAIRKNFKSDKIELVDGVGIDLDIYKKPSNDLKHELREKNGYTSDDFILIYVAELKHRKHQDYIIKSLKYIDNNIPNLKLLLVGKGDKEVEYKNLTRNLGLNKKIDFLGYRNDVKDLMSISDIAVSTSRQEGLPVNIMEAMASGLPVVATDCRGNRDLVKNSVNGFLVDFNNEKNLSDLILYLYNDKDLRRFMGINGREMIEKYSLANIRKHMKTIYNI